MGAKRHIVGLFCVATSGLLFGAPALADLVTSVDVSLIAPGGVQGDSTPINATQTATLAAGIQSGDGGNIGSGYMLDGEKIVFTGNSIDLQVAAGYEDALGKLSTGYLGLGGQHALYQLDNLAIAGQTIVGFNVYDFDGFTTSGFSGLLSPSSSSDYVTLLSATSIAFDLDNLVFADRGKGASNNFADFRIDLLTVPNGVVVSAVPEPDSAFLAAIGLGALLGTRILGRKSRES